VVQHLLSVRKALGSIPSSEREKEREREREKKTGRQDVCPCGLTGCCSVPPREGVQLL
jgi:uncharacterized protein YecA (UPF0149 family)